MKSQIKSSTVISYLTIIINIVVGILFTPFLLRSLGQAEYGLYQLIGAFVGYIAILDFGLGNTIIRYVAKYRAETDKKGEENFLATCFGIYGVISLLVVAVGAVCYFNLQSIFANSLTLSEIDKAKTMFVILVFNLALSLPLNSFQAIMFGYEHFVFPRFLALIRIFIRTGLLVALLLLGYKALAIVILDTLLNLFFMLLKVAYVFLKLKVKIKFHELDKSLLINVFSYSFFVFLGMAVDQVYWRLGQMVLGVVANTATIAVFAVGIQFANYYTTFSTAISGIFLPKATQMAVRNASGEEMTDLLIKTGRIQFTILGLILFGFILFGKKFIILWAGPEYVQSFQVALVVLIPLTIPLFQNIGISILQAKNMHAFRSIIYIIISVVNVLISILLAKKMGAVGAALGTTISLIAGNIVAINLYYHFRVGLNIPRFFKEVFRGLLQAMAVSVAVGSLGLFINGNSWGNLSVQILIYVVAYCLNMWILGLNDYEKNLVLSPLLNMKNKNR